MATIRASSNSGEARSSASANEDSNVCWICLDEGGDVTQVCKCRGMKVHPKCLARWQLQQAGKQEEQVCRFCHSKLPDWKESLAPTCAPRAPPVMAVIYNGKVVRMQVKPGPQAEEEFKDSIRKMFGLPPTMDIDVTFECRAPETGEKLQLNGIQAYSAAMHCAAISAGQRAASRSSSPQASPRHKVHARANRNRKNSAQPEASSSSVTSSTAPSTPRHNLFTDDPVEQPVVNSEDVTMSEPSRPFRAGNKGLSRFFHKVVDRMKTCLAKQPSRHVADSTTR